jgi:hypothetical protein
MRRLMLPLALLLLLWPTTARAQTRPCDQIYVFQHTVPTGPVEAVPGVPNQRIYPCGFVLTAKGNSLDFRLFAAQPGSSCLAESEAFSPQMSLPASPELVTRVENVGPSTEVGFSLCVRTYGSGALTGAIYFAQF